MAANKFATMLHKNTHSLIVILVYAVLEWILILLLLLNSLFSYLIGKFASYFGLKPPCLWCSSINHYLEPKEDGKISSYKDLVCEAHANEISRLWYCTSHRKFSESERLCRDCDNSTEEFSRKVVNFHCDADEGVHENSDSVNRSFDEVLMIRNMKNNHDFDRLILVELTDSSNISREISSSLVRGEDESGKREETDEKSVSKQWIKRKVDLIKENEQVSAETDLEMVVNESATMDQPGLLTEALEGKEEEEEEDARELQVDETASEAVSVLDTSGHDPAGITRAINLNLCENPGEKETEEEKVPNIDDLQQIHKKRSWNGSETEGDNGIEMLKAELEAERKALSALYTELEEERNAAAIAANQTMAMINRLQEEKAAMQMEAVQYQRMMDEQSDYDQEALQLLNDLMMKKEKEKQELEKELEIYRKEEQMKLMEELLTESDNEEERGETNEAWIDCIKHLGSLEESVKEFEEEKISILDELKELEEKLFTLVGNEEQLSEDVKSTVMSTEQSPDDISNGNEYGDGKDLSLKANILLPLFDAAAAEEEELNNEELCKIVTDVDIDENIDLVYERLQALEADREFVKHCVSSVKNGNKDLLQEVLQHLQDLKTAESEVKNKADSPLRIWESGGGFTGIQSSDQLGDE